MTTVGLENVCVCVCVLGRSFSGGSDGKESACNVGNPGSIRGLIPGSRISPGEGKVYPLQYSCLEYPMDIGSWWVTVHRVAKSRPQHTHTHTHTHIFHNTHMS